MTYTTQQLQHSRSRYTHDNIVNDIQYNIRTADRCFLLNRLKDTRDLNSIINNNNMIIISLCVIRIIYISSRSAVFGYSRRPRLL